MAKQSITATPTAIASLTADTAYTVQNRSPYKTYFQTATSAPTDATGAFVVGTNAAITVSRTGTQQVYIWSEKSTGGTGATYGTLVYEQGV